MGSHSLAVNLETDCIGLLFLIMSERDGDIVKTVNNVVLSKTDESS